MQVEIDFDFDCFAVSEEKLLPGHKLKEEKLGSRGGCMQGR